MRTLARVLVGIALFTAIACSPHGRRPGTWLSGELTMRPAAGWSFTSEIPEIFVETRSGFGVPHSVTTVCASHAGSLYVPSVYFEGGEFPDNRRWNRNVARDPRVRVGIAGKLYEGRAELVTDLAERAGVLGAFAAKYPFWQQMLDQPEAERPTLVLLRIDPRRES